MIRILLDDWNLLLWTAIVFIAVAYGAAWYVEQPQKSTPTKSATPRKEKAWKHWEDYWSYHDPLQGAWTHKDPSLYLYYIRDHRTKLCFAVATPFGQGGYMATVPCDRVEHLLKKKL